MDISLLNSQSLLHLLSLTEKKEELLQVLEQIDAEIISTLKGGISVEVFEVTSTPAIASSARVVKKPVAQATAKPVKAKKVKSGKQSGLKNRLLALLETAGDQGLRVKDIAAKLGAKAANISVWFSTTGKDITTKVGPGRYAKKGASKAVAAVANKPVEAPQVAKPAKPAKKKRNISPEGRAKLAANMKARWAARRAAKPAVPAKKAPEPAKKEFKLPKPE